MLMLLVTPPEVWLPRISSPPGIPAMALAAIEIGSASQAAPSILAVRPELPPPPPPPGPVPLLQWSAASTNTARHSRDRLLRMRDLRTADGVREVPPALRGMPGKTVMSWGPNDPHC